MTAERGLCPRARGPPTYGLVAADQELEDVVHGAHVEDETQLRDAHGDQAEQQDGAEHAVHEGGGRCGENRRLREKRAVPPGPTAHLPPRARVGPGGPHHPPADEADGWVQEGRQPAVRNTLGESLTFSELRL